MSTQSLLLELESTFGTSEESSSGTIEREKVRAWIKSADEIEVQGALCSYLLDRKHTSRITPELEFRDFHPFVSNYLLRCIAEDPRGRWADSRYEAGIALANWFKALNRDQSVPRETLTEIKAAIESGWDNGNAEVRDGILNGAVEHIFEDESAIPIFDDWRSSSRFSELYDSALAWKSGNPQKQDN